MTSVLIPTVDLAPGMPSRVVTISATDVTEGGTSMAGQMVRFALSDTLDVTSGGDVIAKTEAEVVLDANGNGSIRLPVYNPAVKTWCGDEDWAVLVTATWGSQKAIRVPAGTTSIALSSLPPVRALRGREKQWAITGVSVSVTVGTQAGQASGSATVTGGIINLGIVLPPAGPHTHEQSDIVGHSLWSSSDNLNAWWKAGIWGVTGAQGMPPGVGSALMIQVQAGNKAWQRIWVSFGNDSRTWVQWGNETAGTWHPATLLETTGTKWDASDDLNAWWRSGTYGVTGAQGMPPGVTSAIMIQAEAGNGAWQRIWISFGQRAEVWLQWGNEVQGNWATPQPLNAAGGTDSALAHQLQVQDLQRRRGRTATAKGVVVFVLDHGYSGFTSKAWPDLQARGFPVTWALNTVHPAAIDTGDAGIDWAAIKNLAATNPETLEIAAHSAAHANVTEDAAALRAAIVGHKADLEQKVGQKVDSWVQPGNGLGDFTKDNGGSPEMYAGTAAGRMIAANYAAATGYILSPRTFALDGVPDLGVVGSWLDTGVGNIMTYVNSVATNGGYTIIRLHPQHMDQAGYITRAQWQGFLDQVKALVDAGSVQVMTLRDASVATASTAHTHPIEQVVGLRAELNGIFAPKTISGSGANLNNLMAPGRYRVNASSDSSLANNFPIDGPNAVVDVEPWGVGGNVIQTVKYPRDHGVWMRGYWSGVWRAWQNVGPEGAGPRLTALEYDSGWRNVPLLSGTGGTFRLRRTGRVIEFSLANYRPVAGTQELVHLPSGFRPSQLVPIWASDSATPRQGFALNYSPWAVELRSVPSAGTWVSMQATWITDNAIPTTLPGTPG